MNRKQLIAAWACLLILAFTTPALCECPGLSVEECVKLVAFSKKAKEVKSKLERSGGVSSLEVKQILGKPEAIYRKNEEELRIKGQKEIWMYWHPCYASVRFLLVFNKDDKLVLFTAVQQLNPNIGDVYYDVDYLLE